MTPKVAIVTGSNKGIGYAIVRALCKNFDGDVYLTARDSGRGQEAVQKLEQEGLKPKFHKLDISSQTSVLELKDFIKEQYGGLDVLCNNAGIMLAGQNSSFYDVAKETIDVNYYNTLFVCKTFLPLLRSGSRVCNISSSSISHLFVALDKHIQDKITDPKLTWDGMSQIMDDFVAVSKEADYEDKGYRLHKLDIEGFKPTSMGAYAMSKVGATLTASIMQREVDSLGLKDALINSCCPGFTSTDLTGNAGGRTPDQAADTPAWLCTLPPNAEGPRGEFVNRRKVFPWTEQVYDMSQDLN